MVVQIRLSLLCVLAVLAMSLDGSVPRSSLAQTPPPTRMHDSAVNYCVSFGPSPIGISNTSGSNMWLVCQVENLSGHDDLVQISSATNLMQGTLPEGCTGTGTLLIPGRTDFVLLAGEMKHILYRVRFECHAPATDARRPLTLEVAIDHIVQPPDTDDATPTNDTRLVSTSLTIGEPGPAPQPPPSPGGMKAMSIDMDPAAAPANSAVAIGSREECARIDENNVLDQDEDVVADTVTLDVTALDIPQSNAMIGFVYRLNYSAANLTVESSNANLLLASGPASGVFDLRDVVPDDNATNAWLGGAFDFNVATESGSGVLQRLTVTSEATALAGVYPLTLSENVHFDSSGVPLTPGITGDAAIAIGTECPAPPALVGGDARAVRIHPPRRVDGSGDVYRKVTVVVANEGSEPERIAVYVDAIPPADGDCQPSGRISQEVLTIEGGSRQAFDLDGYPGDPVAGDSRVVFRCGGPLAADDLNYLFMLGVDVHADDAASCPSGSLASEQCTAALADDDTDVSDNVLVQPFPKVVIREH